MGRPTAFDPQEKLHIAMKLFWRQGFEATSLQQLCDELELNRFSIYNTFGDKRALFHLTLDHYLNTVIRRIAAPLLHDDAELDAVVEYLAGLSAGLCSEGGRVGCYVQNAGSEMGSVDELVQKKVDDWLRQLEMLLAQALIRARDNNGLRGDIDAEAAACYLVSVTQGLIALRRTCSRQCRVENAFKFLMQEVRGWAA
ncbi:TetR/AcrR family transcriptional regulator [Hahella aquimaris]|uniref:TetR/AcrR family transcriptional regulator n=1 Tax=Hahella sp. HNIBRBA332 TaxID=3015983 RepID=UPI00273BD999|nr:TetR/AcrR family transcriptional regulator [Hahella sp. HNIBRBA332]WLQ13657.1 TetR/AcrR family transcriptional regulator [Hahella sp. HNIBRBA332]